MTPDQPVSVLPCLAWMFTTVGVYLLGGYLYARWRSVWLSPFLVSFAALILILKMTGGSFAAFQRGTQPISFLLGPGVVALGLPFYRQLERIQRSGKAILLAVFAGSVGGMLSVTLIAKGLGTSREVIASLLPKSVTSPIAIGISAQVGGIPSLTAGIVVFVGVFGAMVAPWFFGKIGVRSPSAWGLAIGAGAHGLGTARAIEEGEEQAALSGLALCLNGLITAILAPLLMQWF